MRRFAAGIRGRCLLRKDTSPLTPTRNVGAFRFLCPPSRHCDSRPCTGRQSRRFLETGLLVPPPAALRLFPPPPNDTKEGATAPSFGFHPREWGVARHGSGSGKRSREHPRLPTVSAQAIKLRRRTDLRTPVERTRQETENPHCTDSHDPRTANSICDPKAFFFWTVHGPFSLAQPKKMGGASPAADCRIPRAAKRHIPPSRRQAA